MIIPKQLGYITIRATANSVLAGDSVEHKLLVNVTINFFNLLTLSPYVLYCNEVYRINMTK